MDLNGTVRLNLFLLRKAASTGWSIVSAFAMFGVLLIGPVHPVEGQIGKAHDPEIENPIDWLGPDSYPAAAREAGAEGRVVARLAVDANGTVTGCTIEVSSGSAPLDEGTCALAKSKARFRPARDRRNRAIAGTAPLKVLWQLQRDEFLRDETFGGEIDISPDGKVVACRNVGQMEHSGNSAVKCDYPDPNTKSDRGYTLTIHVTRRLGTVLAADQLPPADAEVLTLRIVRLTINELGNVIECIPIRNVGFTENDPVQCPDDGRNLGVSIGENGQPRVASMMYSYFVVKRPLNQPRP